MRPNKLIDVIKSLSPSSILDVGCGRGELIEQCRNLGIEAYGLESDQKKYFDMYSRGLSVELGKAEYLDMEDNSIDICVLARVLHHLERPELALKEAARVAVKFVLVLENYFPQSFELERYSDYLSKAIHRASGRFYHADPPSELLISDMARGSALEVVETFVLKEREGNEYTKSLKEIWEYHNEYLQYLDEDDVLAIAARKLLKQHGEDFLRGAPAKAFLLRSS